MPLLDRCGTCHDSEGQDSSYGDSSVLVGKLSTAPAKFRGLCGAPSEPLVKGVGNLVLKHARPPAGHRLCVWLPGTGLLMQRFWRWGGHLAPN